MKDLPDLVLLGSVGVLGLDTLRRALAQTFTFRETHPLPAFLPEPPLFWEQPYAAMADADDLPWRTLREVHRAAAAFLDPALAKEGGEGAWDPERWEWGAR